MILVIRHRFLLAESQPAEWSRLSLCPLGRHSPAAAGRRPRVIFCGGPSVSLAAWFYELPQFDRVSFRVMQASKPPVGVGLRINFHLKAARSQLGCHFIQIAYPKVYHPYLARILEIVSRF